MTIRTRKNLQRLSNQTRDIAVAAPQVVALRLSQFATSAAAPTSKDIAEFNRMIVEKQVAFFQAWGAMAAQAMLVQQTLAVNAVQLAFTPWWNNPQNAASALVKQMQNSPLSIANKGLAPIRRKAVANAKRLSKH